MKYYYKVGKRIKKLGDNTEKNVFKKLKDNGYVQIMYRFNPEGSIVKKTKPKAKKKVKKK